jgi:(R)-2-hydroxyacyl-CoA dehydratese activating ATPase
MGVAQRVGNMVQKLGLVKEVAFVGGVAKNQGARKTLEDFLEVRFVPETRDPQLNGALGAALLAQEIYCSPDAYNVLGASMPRAN